MSTKTFPPFEIDQTLTPETAWQRGYLLVCDALPRFLEENRDLIVPLLTDGCILGAGSDSTPNDTVGIYQPLGRKRA
jgi:hypothetical protein